MENPALRDITPIFISDDQKIQNVFRLAWWTVDEGLDRIQGIFHYRQQEDEIIELHMLDGQQYSRTEHQAEIEKLEECYDLLKAIWDRTGRKRKRYPPSIFINFGLKYPELTKMPWLADAEKKG